MDKISIVLPSYNEEESIPLFYEEMKKTMEKMKNVNFELIFVNDGSKDNSIGEIRKLAQKDKRVRYINFSRNFGKEAAMLAGLEATTGDYITVMDVDLQEPPYLIEKMYNLLIAEEDYDCIGLRSSDHKSYGFVRKFLTGCYYKVISWLSDVEMISGARDCRLMTRQMLNSVLELRENSRYIKGLFSFVGYNTKWLEYEEPDRVAGTSTFNIRRLFKYAFEAIISFSTKPLLMSAAFGILFCFIAFIMIIFIILKTLIWGDPVSGWPSLVCIIMFCSGLQMLFLGIIGEYISKIYLESKDRPIYIIKDTEEYLNKKVRKEKEK